MGTRRQGGYIGAYIGDELKRALEKDAWLGHRNLSQHLTHVIEAHLGGLNAERDECAKAVCNRCRDERPEWHAVERLFYHCDGTVCAASRIHERGLETDPEQVSEFDLEKGQGD